ncbi:MAG: hypothetical protein HUU22_10555 [Phycisphaerae bacterium]|nr:hypothetical protein [Phycisphaerae bacterium]NUQ46463.1 hypothetical protein [Phycisphaerae bacterium]
MRNALIAILIVATCPLACNQPGFVPSTSPPSRDQAWDLYQPCRIDILPFTKPKSFDADPYPDGVEVAVRLIDALDDPVKAWGTFQFELYHFRPASGEPRGERAGRWTMQLASVADQRHYWDRVTQTYRFPLGWEGTPLMPDKKYILDVSFQPPDHQRIMAQPYTLVFNPDIESLRRARSVGR